MLRAQVDQETTPNDTSALRSRGGRHRNFAGGATRDGFSMRSDAASESEQDSEEGSDEALAASPSGFIEILTPLAGQMAFEIVTALFANYREMESAYADLKRMHARIRTSEKKEWHGIFTDLIAFMQKCAPMLPDMARSKVTTTCGALEQVEQLWSLCDSIRKRMNDPELAWYDKPGLIATELRKCKSAAAYLPDSFRKWLDYACEAQEQFTASHQAIRYFKRELSSAESGGLAMIAAIQSILDSKAFKLAPPLRNFLHALPRTADELQAYRGKVDSLLSRFNELSQVGSITEGLSRIQKLVSAGLIDMRGLSAPLDSLLDTASQVGQWYGDLTELRAILGATLEARNANEALAQVSKVLNLHSLKALLGERLLESLRTATEVLAGLSESFGIGQGINGRLTSIVHGDEPLRQKLTEASRLISKTPQIPEDFRASLSDVTDTLDKLSAALSFASMKSKARMLEQIAEALHAFKRLTGNPFVQRSLGADASRHSARVIGTMAQALDIVGLLEKLIHHDATFEVFVTELMNMRGEGNALSEALERLSGFADSVLQSLEPAGSKAGKLGALLRWLAHPEAEKLILSGVPIQYKDTTQNAMRLYRQISAFPATGSWDSQRAWLREHLVNADTLHKLIGANEEMVTRWRNLFAQNDAVIALLKRFLPLINGDKLTLTNIRSVLCSREGLGAAQHALSASLFHMESTVAYGIGTVVDQGIGLGLALTDEDEATRRSTMESVVTALDNIFRSTVARYLGAANPGVAVLTDALYSILLAPMMKKVPGAFAEHVTTADRESCKKIAKALARTLLSASPSVEEFKENVKRFAVESPALAGVIRTGAGIVQQIGSHVWEIHLALDVYLLIRAEPSRRAERIQALTATLATLREHGYEWAGPLASLAPLLPDLDEARKLLKRELPQAESWFEWGIALSPMLAQSNAPSVVRLRRALAGQIATALRGGFHRLVQFGFSERTGHDVRSDADARLDVAQAQADSLHAAWLALAPKAGAAAAPLFQRAARSFASIPLIRNVLARLRGAQPTYIILTDSPLANEYEDHEVQLSDDNLPDARGIYHQGARRYIRVEGRTFCILFDRGSDILRLSKPGASEGTGRMTGPAIAFREGRWFITSVHKMHGGADDEEALQIEMARFEAAYVAREVKALLDIIEAGTYPFAEIETLKYQLSDFQLTCEQLKAAVEALEQPAGPWTGTSIGSGLAMLGLLALIYYWYTSRSPFQPRRNVPADSNDAHTESGEAIALMPMSADGHHVVELPVAAEPEAVPRRGKYDRFPQIAGVVLLVSGGVVVLESWARTWLRREQDAASLPEQPVAEPEAGPSTAHQIVKRAVQGTSSEQDRSALAKYLDDYKDWKLDDKSINMPDNIDDVLCVYDRGTYYIKVDEKFWKITQPQRSRFNGSPFQIEPSIRYFANLAPRKDYFAEVVYTESLGWRFAAKWGGGTYPEITPDAPLHYLEHFESKSPQLAPSYWLDAFLLDRDEAVAYSGKAEPERRENADPKRVFDTPQSGNLIESNYAYWPLTWWRLWKPDLDPTFTFTAAGYVTHGTGNGDKTLFVYDENRGWMPAVFADGNVNIFNSLDTFHRFGARYRTGIEPLLVPSTKSLVDQVIERRFSEVDAVPGHIVGPSPKSLGHQVYWRIETARYSDVVTKYYYRKDEKYWSFNLEEADQKGGAFAGPDLTHHGHFEYDLEGQKRLLYVVLSKTKGLLPSVMNDQGKLDGMSNPSSASNTTASPSLLELGRTFGNSGAYDVQGQQRGQDGSLYYDLLSGRSDVLMFLGGKYWPFQWRNDSEGGLVASFSDESQCDVILRLADNLWALDWEGRSAPSWFTECLRIMMARGEVGVRLIREAEKEWADRPLMNANETMQIFSACLSRFEAEYRSAGKSEKWRSVMILTAQLFAFFAREVRSQDFQLQFSRQVIGQLGRMVMQDDLSERIDASIMDDAVESFDSINAIEEIDAELTAIDEQTQTLSKAYKETRNILLKAGEVVYAFPLWVFGTKPKLDKVPQLFDLVLQWIFNWNDLTHNVLWAEEYLAWLDDMGTQLDEKRKVLQDRRAKLGSPERYKQIFDAYQAGIGEGKKLEERYAFAIDWRAGDFDVNQRTLWSQYSGALAELALDAQRSRKPGGANDASDAKTESARHYLWMQFFEASRFQELIKAVGSKMEGKKMIPKGRYTDLTDCVVAAAEIIYDENSDEIEFFTTDLAFLAVIIYAISTTSQSIGTLRGMDYNGLRATFLEKGKSLHPFIALPDKPESYFSMADIKPSSLFGDAKRYEGYGSQFTRYRETGLQYDAGVMIKTGLQNVELAFAKMYDVKAIVNLDIQWVGVLARAHLIQLNDDSCLFYFFLKQPAVTDSSEPLREYVVERVKNWHTGMEWLPQVPRSPEAVKEYSSALRAMRPFLVDALSDLTVEAGRPGIYFGTVHRDFKNVRNREKPRMALVDTKDKISPPADSVISTQLVPYLLKETEKDLDRMTDLLYSSMLELSPTDKWIGFFVVFYSQLKKADLDKNYKVDSVAIMVDAATLLLTVGPWARASVQIVRKVGLGAMWKVGTHLGLHGRKLISHVIAQIPFKSVWKLFRELGAMLFELFFPFTYPFNPGKLNFRGLILKNRSLVKLRSPDELLSDTRLIKGFLENVFLPPSIATLAKAPVKPQGTVVRVGPDLFRSQLVSEVDEQPHAIYYIKVGDLYYAIGWDTNFDLAVLADSHSPFPSYLRRRFADWVENTSPRRGGGAASPTWAGAGFDPTSERARAMVMELRVAKSDALDMLQQARETATSDASEIQEKVKQAFEIFLNDASRSTIRSFANNLSAIIDFLKEISAASDVAFLNDKTGNRLSAMPGSAFDIAVTYDPAAAIYREDVEAKHIQKMDAITGPGIINDTDNAGFLQYPTRDHIIPLSMQDDQFDVGQYTFDVTAHLVRANEFCRSVIREGFVATTKNKRIARKWTYLTTTAEPNLAKMSAADKQVFFDQLSQTYGMFVFEGQPLEARPSAAFVNAGSRGWDRTGEEVGIDISSLLNTARTRAEGESATAARVGDPDLFSFLVIVLSDIKADPPRFEDFTARVAKSKPGEPLLWRWFKKDPSA
ncbi:hypothetical protein [Caballeronia sp. LZ034LL]|uniref:hypothetical protein n=1 Tax=Caballeronia sp. LZ034LL TaxID=3038567 RepID=UPI00285818EE|nr:hypothetical protein [Caballeronia sp. LZ034LL]MDR5839252.1 hypothetical protein [Caballeronia sp. LZ034LL]